MDSVLADTVGWGLIVGTALPWLTAVVQQPHWSGNARRVVAAVAAVVAGVLTCLADGTLAVPGTVLQTVAAVLIASQAAYGTLLRPSSQAVERRVLNRSGGRHAAGG